MDLYQIITQFGVPVGLLVAIGIGCWRCLVWAAPRLDRLAEAHIAYLHQTGEQTIKHGELLETQNGLLKEQKGLLQEQSGLLRGIRADLKTSCRYQPTLLDNRGGQRP